LFVSSFAKFIKRKILYYIIDQLVNAQKVYDMPIHD